MAGHAIKHAVERSKVDPKEIEDCILGCGLPEGATGHNVARNAAEAHKEGGFLGIGGTKVSEAESQALERLAETIGYQAPPLEPTDG